MKKWLTALLSLALLVSASTGAMAVGLDIILAPLPINSAPATPAAAYVSVTGTVKEVFEYVGVDQTPVEGRFLVLIEDEQGNPATFFLSEETYYPFADTIAVGEKVTGYYLANQPMIMIYPPQYPIQVLVAGNTEQVSVKVDRFIATGTGEGTTLLSGDALLVVHIGDDTQVVSPDGTPFEGELDGCDLVVLYTVTTRSLPPQTTPSKVVVLGQRPELQAVPVSEMPIIVEDAALLTPPAPFENDQGVVMVPLRAVAEALGYTVTWHGEEDRVELDGTVKLWIGRSECRNGAEQFQLSTNPVIRNDLTYVPLFFFTQVLGANNAYVFEGQIVVDQSGEIMH